MILLDYPLNRVLRENSIVRENHSAIRFDYMINSIVVSIVKYQDFPPIGFDWISEKECQSLIFNDRYVLN